MEERRSEKERKRKWFWACVCLWPRVDQVGLSLFLFFQNNKLYKLKFQKGKWSMCFLKPTWASLQFCQPSKKKKTNHIYEPPIIILVFSFSYMFKGIQTKKYTFWVIGWELRIVYMCWVGVCHEDAYKTRMAFYYGHNAIIREKYIINVLFVLNYKSKFAFTFAFPFSAHKIRFLHYSFIETKFMRKI